MRTSGSKILYLLPLALLLLACNLSAGATQSTQVIQTIITATPKAETQLEVASEVTTDSDTETNTTINSATNIQDTNIISSEPSASESDNLYYVRGSRPQNQCGIQATVTTNIRTANNTSASIVGQLIGSEWVAISRLVSGWYQIDLSGTVVHRMWISSEPTVLDSICTCNSNGCARQQVVPPTPNLDPNLFYAGNPQPYPSDGCYVYTAGNFNVNIRSAQSETSERLGQLYANSWLPVDFFINGWFGVDLPNTPIDGAYISNGPVRLSATCICDEFSCQKSQLISTCEITTHSNNTKTLIYTEPANWSTVVGELTHGTVYTATGTSTSGWYQLYNGGWVPANYLKILSPDACRNAPKIPYSGPLLDCDLVNTTDEIATIRVEPDGEYYGRFRNGLSLGIIKREGDWYQLYVPAFESAGWVDGSAMTLSGNCDSFR